MRNLKGNVVVLLLALFGLVATGTAFYFYQKSQNSNPSTSITTSNSETSNKPSFANLSNEKSKPNSSATPTDETANWKTYSSSLWRISFKYPPTTKPTGSQPVQITEDGQKQIVVGVYQTDMTVFITKTPNPSKLLPLQWWKSLKRSCRDTSDKPVINTTLISGQEAVAVNCISDKFVYITFKDQMFALEGTNDQTNGNLFLDQILSTFKFLN